MRPSARKPLVALSERAGHHADHDAASVALLIGMSLTMVLAVSSESLINGYYGRYRGSFYAADSGVAAARQHS